MAEFVELLAKLSRTARALAGIPRIGWIQRKVRSAETVLEHMFLTAMFSAALASRVGADVKKAVAMALVHDIAEAELGNVGVRLRSVMDWRSVERDVVKELGLEPLEELYSEYASGSSVESVIVSLADKLATLTTACEYSRMGYPTEDLVESYRKSVLDQAWPEIKGLLEEVVKHFCGNL